LEKKNLLPEERKRRRNSRCPDNWSNAPKVAERASQPRSIGGRGWKHSSEVVPFLLAHRGFKGKASGPREKKTHGGYEAKACRSKGGRGGSRKKDSFAPAGEKRRYQDSIRKHSQKNISFENVGGKDPGWRKSRQPAGGSGGEGEGPESRLTMYAGEKTRMRRDFSIQTPNMEGRLSHEDLPAEKGSASKTH